MNESAGTIYVYEDDEDLAREIVAAFAEVGLTVLAIRVESELREVVAVGAATVLILDRLIEGQDSLFVIEELRARHDRVPIVVISSLDSVDERIRGLRAGGDDYLVKPFAMGELIARVQSLNRRADARTKLTVGPLKINLLSREVTRGNRDIKLTQREFELLYYFMRHANQVVTRSMLLEEVWKYNIATMTNVVDVYVSNLRRKVDGESERKRIERVPRVGYILRTPQ